MREESGCACRFQRPFVAWLQRLLRETSIGELFFANVAKPGTVKSILQQCYGDRSAVTDELVRVARFRPFDAKRCGWASACSEASRI